MIELAVAATDCYYEDTIDQNEFDNLPIEDICFNPAKFLIVNENMCNVNVNTVRAVFYLLLENDTNIFVYEDFLIKKQYKTQCENYYYEFKKSLIHYNWKIKVRYWKE